MKRRDFVETLLVLPVGVFLVECGSNSYSGSNGYGGSSGGSSGSNAPAAPPAVSGSQAVYASSEVLAHHHTFGIELGYFTNPPSSGLSGETSEEGQHHHSVSVSMADLQSVETGNSVTVTTGTTAGHSHVFTFTKVSA